MMESFGVPRSMTEKELEILATIEELTQVAGREDAWHDQMIDFAEALKNNYPNQCDRYILYHKLIGSTPDGRCDRFDFSGDDSIELFARKKLEAWKSTS